MDARKTDMDALNMAANAVVANWGSTDPYKVIICGIPVITMMFPDDDLRDREERGCLNGVPPILVGQEQWGATSAQQMVQLLGMVKRAESEFQEYAKKIRAKPFLYLAEGPGVAAAKIAAEVLSILK